MTMRTKRTYSIVEIEFAPEGDTVEASVTGKRVIKSVNVIENVPADELESHISSDDPDRRFHLFIGNEVQWKETRTIQLGEKRARTRKPKSDTKPETSTKRGRPKKESNGAAAESQSEQ
jgi:hypothetical protein